MNAIKRLLLFDGCKVNVFIWKFQTKHKENCNKNENNL